ncbi:response regulator transcription factor [Sphingomonas suaedae]|uniref:Response regulator transcription factor n=1 Tax=Sphingomonas suaedae TaxID=2599297 RepID=A0A518RIY8_9SPHN|nr:response regulator [Sphingomonas suaedae]QDX27426.1 response regulator transcription factor [Sphingomonas suaedae]
MTKRLVHLVDDDPAIRRAVSFVLKTSGFEVKAYESGVAFLKEVRHAEPGCILLDIRMPDKDGLEVQRDLNAMGVDMPVVMLTGHGDVAAAVQAMKEGAVDFLEKPSDKADLLRAIEAAFVRIERSDQRDAAAHQAQVRIAALTPREREVLEGLAQGLPNKTIAYDLGISPRTVEVHRANVMSKLDVPSFPDALRIAFAAGLGKSAAS